MKLAVVYHSETGNTEQVANIIAEGARTAGKLEVKTMGIDNIDGEFIEQSAAVVFGTPTYVGDLSWRIKKWLDKDSNGTYDLSDKLGAVFATEKYLGGGADSALLTLAGHLMVKGMIVYSGGAANGQPYTHYGAVCLGAGNDKQQERAEIFGRRVASKALELFTETE